MAGGGGGGSEGAGEGGRAASRDNCSSAGLDDSRAAFFAVFRAAGRVAVSSAAVSAVFFRTVRVFFAGADSVLSSSATDLVARIVFFRAVAFAAAVLFTGFSVASESTSRAALARLVVAFLRVDVLGSSSRYGVSEAVFDLGDGSSVVARFRASRLMVRRLSVMKQSFGYKMHTLGIYRGSAVLGL